MGRAKEEMIRRQDENNNIVAMLIEEGGVNECPVHVDIHIDAEDSAADECVAGQWAKENGCTVDEARDRVQNAKSSGEVYDECPYCAKNAASD
jgi:hypothetical protein